MQTRRVLRAVLMGVDPESHVCLSPEGVVMQPEVKVALALGAEALKSTQWVQRWREKRRGEGSSDVAGQRPYASRSPAANAPHNLKHVRMRREVSTMVTGGNATVSVSDMDASVRFYSETLGLKLVERYGNHWASVRAGDSLVLGLHPRSDRVPEPGSKGSRGSIQIGLAIDEPIAEAMERLTAAGVSFRSPVERTPQGQLCVFW